MKVQRRTQSQRTASTRGALVGAGRALFGERGFAEVGTTEIARVAGVSRGAIYHHFADKTDLFLAVVEEVEIELTARLVDAVAAAGADDPTQALLVAVDTWFEVAREKEVRRLVLTEAPAVLGWAGWRALVAEHGQGMTEELLRAGIESGQLVALPVGPLATVLLGALNEGALHIASASDPEAAEADVRAVVSRLLTGLLA